MIKKAGERDLETLAQLAALMWESHSWEELMEEFSDIMKSGESLFLLSYEDGAPVGFAQCRLRHDYVEGTCTSPVGYPEGIFVKEDYRRRGCAAAMLSECEAWAKAMGCSEFASDCEPENTDSFNFHMAAGFEEAKRIVCFAKKI